MNKRETRRLIVALTGVGLALGVSALAPALAAPSVPSGTITRIGSFPSYHSTSVAALADNVNDYLYEFDYFKCPNLLRLDPDTYATVATDNIGKNGTCKNPAVREAGSGDPVPNLTFDSKDKIAFTVDNLSNVSLLDEVTLKQLGSWAPPAAVAGASAYYFSWYPADDELVVLLYNPNNPIPALYVTALSIPLSLKAGTSVALWTTQVPGCQQPLNAHFATAAAYHATQEAAVYVPCIIEPATNSSPRDAVVKLTLGPKAANGAPCVAPAKECPTGTSSLTALPQPVNDFIFDPGADRGFLPTASDAIVYDGRGGVLEGRTAIGTPADDNKIALGLNPSIGRIYTVSHGDGFMVIDARRSPVNPGYKFMQYADSPIITTFPVLLPDQAYPYTRVVVPHPDPSGVTTAFVVYADTLPPGEDPPANAVDVNTYNGVIPAGADRTDVYSGTARGFGFHSDYVGGASAVFENNVQEGNLPLPFTSTTDLMGAAVQKLSYGSSSSEGDASALADPNGGTAYNYSQCTGATSETSCLPVPCPVSSCTLPSLSPAPAPPSTNQGWPYPDAVCYQPGPDSQKSGSVTGAYVTNPAGTPVSDNDGNARASVDCSGKGGVATGSALMQGSATQDPTATLPVFKVQEAHVQSTVTDLSARGQGVVSETTAEAHGVEIDIPGGPIVIGGVVQHAKVTAAGRTGTARVLDDTVTFSNVVVAGQELCSASCTQQQFDQLNSQFPAEIDIFRPAADDRYNDPKTRMGSPGGYLAVVQANLPEQFGDQQFNAMTAEESSFLPALRIVLYGHAEGHPQINREIIDLAGVEADAEYGIQVISEGGGSGYQPVDLNQAAQYAGVAQPPAIPDKPASVSTRTSGSLLKQVIGRVLKGIQWLLHSPGAAIEMGLFLAVLFLPLMLMRRRWTWPGSTLEVVG